MQHAMHGTVLETKLIPPTAAGELVRRERLVSRALLGVQARLVLVDAPAGYGKTSVLAQVYDLLQEQRRPAAWLSLDAADNDHARFLSYFVAAVRKSGIRFGASTAALLGSGAPLPANILRTSLLNEILALEDDLFVFLDDYHCIVDAEVRETIVALLSAPLTRLHLVIASRGRNELPLGRLRSIGQLTHIDGTEIAFSEAEAGEFLCKTSKLALDPQQVARLCERTEGWAASLQLACIALRDGGDVDSFLKSFSGTTRSVEDLLTEEVLQRQAPELQSFLIETSILGRFSVSLANEVTGRDDARQIIGDIEAKNLFLFSLDDQSVWYRYHHLFADFLKRRLADRDPRRLVELHRRAADWLARNAFFPEAIDHAFLAGDSERAGTLLEMAAGPLYATGQVGTLQKYAARLPPEVRRRLPRLQLELSWNEEIEWRFDEARATLDSVRRSLHAGSPAPCATESDDAFLVSKLAHREMMLRVLKDQLPEAGQLCADWTRETASSDPFMRASVGTALMVANRERYRCAGVPTDAEDQRLLFLEGGAVYGTVFHDSATGSTLFARGELDQAERCLERARRCAAELHGEQSTLAAMPGAMLAELCYERGELFRARDLLTRHSGVSAEFGWLDHAIARFVTLSRMAFLENRHEDARAALEAGAAIAAKRDMPRLRAHIVAERIRQAILRAEGRLAAGMYADWDGRESSERLLPGENPTVIDELAATSWARLCIDRGKPASAVHVLKRWVQFTRERQCLRSFMRLSVVLAAAFQHSGDGNAARRTVLEALHTCPRTGFVRSFLDEGPVMMAVLESLAADHAHSGDDIGQRLNDLVLGQSFAPPLLSAGPAGTPAAKADYLSAREIDIIRFSAQGMATSDIAKAASLSESTIKWYWNRIFSKLHVHRRFDAIKIAKQNNWIS